MPKGKGLYKRKGAQGRIMYFRDGKMISKKSYLASMTRRGSTKGSNPRRSTTRRKTTMARKRTFYSRKRAMPHPSITGLASGLTVAQYINTGGGSTAGTTVLKLLKTNPTTALEMASANTVNLATTDVGKKVLSSAIVLAFAGGVARKWFPSIKLGGSKIYARI